jgi:phage shock protein PspC (stress-responsive transcriptional regulator)
MRIKDVLARTVVVFLMVLSAWFGGLMTGVIGLGWLVHWLGTPKLEPPWDRIAFFGPAVIAAAAYFVYQMVLSRETDR